MSFCQPASNPRQRKGSGFDKNGHLPSDSMLRRFAILASALASLAASVVAQSHDEYEQPPILYSDSIPKDAVATLQARLNAREFSFEGREKDVLRRLLRELKVPESSQMLVFSKTSVQRTRISPDNPRSLYFNDECYVGWVPGGMIEIASIDPQLGPIFYTLDPLERGKEPQRFRRDSSCLSCHGANFTRDIPGVFARSVFAESTGSPIFSAGSTVVDYTTPFEDRWGGWFVTGSHGKARHRGNVFASEVEGEVQLDVERGANVTDLSEFTNSRFYPRPTSDIGALMVMEHQLAMHQALTRANFEARRMLAYQRGLQESFKEPLTDEPAYDSVKSVFKHAAENVLDALLFKDEAAMPEGGIQGSREFVEAYEAAGPRTSKGISLRELDFKTRIARYRCSPLVYSAQFRALPAPLLARILERLGRVLTAPEPEPRYAYLADDERKAIAAILHETAPEFTASWKK
jgi:hypothetical protein